MEYHHNSQAKLSILQTWSYPGAQFYYESTVPSYINSDAQNKAAKISLNQQELINPLFYYNTPRFGAVTPYAVPVVTAENIKASKVNNKEPTTSKPKNLELAKTSKLQRESTREQNISNDLPLLAAVQQINPQYIVEDILPIPGKLIYSSQPQAAKHSSKTSDLKTEMKQKIVEASAPFKVEATGKTSTDRNRLPNIPQIPFGTYFLPYLSQAATETTKNAALILEPHSKAVVGNGGTAISTPISRAVLKKGVPTNVYFNPESVAIAGVGGKAHAQADLILELLNRR